MRIVSKSLRWSWFCIVLNKICTLRSRLILHEKIVKWVSKPRKAKYFFLFSIIKHQSINILVMCSENPDFIDGTDALFQSLAVAILANALNKGVVKVNIILVVCFENLEFFDRVDAAFQSLAVAILADPLE